MFFNNKALISNWFDIETKKFKTVQVLIERRITRFTGNIFLYSQNKRNNVFIFMGPSKTQGRYNFDFELIRYRNKTKTLSSDRKKNRNVCTANTNCINKSETKRFFRVPWPKKTKRWRHQFYNTQTIRKKLQKLKFQRLFVFGSMGKSYSTVQYTVLEISLHLNNKYSLKLQFSPIFFQ